VELVHCIYCSAAASGAASPTDLAAILEVARRNNEGRNVTGILLYEGGNFLQVLEGDRAAVDKTFECIASDPRHRRVNKIIDEPIIERTFACWSMGYPLVTRADLARIPGLNDFFTRGHTLRELGEGRIKTILEAFKDGRWRPSMS